MKIYEARRTLEFRTKDAETGNIEMLGMDQTGWHKQKEEVVLAVMTNERFVKAFRFETPADFVKPTELEPT